GVSDALDDKSQTHDEERQPVAAEHAAAFATEVLVKYQPPDDEWGGGPPPRNDSPGGVRTPPEVLVTPPEGWERLVQELLEATRQEPLVAPSEDVGFLT